MAVQSLKDVSSTNRTWKTKKQNSKQTPPKYTVGKYFLRIIKSMKQQSEVNLFQISSCMNIEQIKNIKSEPNKKK